MGETAENSMAHAALPRPRPSAINQTSNTRPSEYKAGVRRKMYSPSSAGESVPLSQQSTRVE